MLVYLNQITRLLIGHYSSTHYILIYLFLLPDAGHGGGRESHSQEQSGTQSAFAAGTETGRSRRVFKLNHVVVHMI